MPHRPLLPHSCRRSQDFIGPRAETATEQADLLDLLLAITHEAADAIDKDWEEEIHRRVEEIDSGEVELQDSDQSQSASRHLMIARFHPLALQELSAAIVDYHELSKTLAQRHLLAVEHARANIVYFREAWPPGPSYTLRFILPDFPYQIGIAFAVGRSKSLRWYTIAE